MNPYLNTPEEGERSIDQVAEFLHERFAAEWEPNWVDLDDDEQRGSEYRDMADALVSKFVITPRVPVGEARE